MTLPIAWKPHPGPQEEALRRGEYEILYGGARGGGKTDAGQVWLVEPDYIKNPKYRFLVLRKNAKDLSDWIDRAKHRYHPLRAEFVGKIPEIRFPSGAIGRAGHLKDKNAFEQYIGHEYQKILLEELTLIPSEESYQKVITSARSTVPGLVPQVFSTTNPGNAGHIWVKNRFVKHGSVVPYFDSEIKKWRIYIPAKVTDNPTLMKNDPGYLAMLNGLPDKLRRAWRDGDWDVFEGQFFDTWNERTHVYEPFRIPKEWPRIRSIDWGFSDAFCCLWAAIGPDNHVWVYREFYRNRLTDSEYAETINGLSKYHDGSDERIDYTVGDPISFWTKNPETGVERVETYNLNGIPILKGDNSRVNGWGRVREYLQLRQYQSGMSPWLHISRECRNLIRTLPALVHDDHVVEDVADGMEDHAPDALRLLLQSRTPNFPTGQKRYRNNIEAALAQAERNEKKGVDLWR